MPKNRHRKQAQHHPRNDRPANPDPAAPAATRALPAGVLALLIAIVLSGVLALDAFELINPPGCGVDGGCGAATSSAFGSVPLGFADWPASFLGLAYFLAMLVAWIATRGRVTTGMKLMLAAGALGSAFYVAVMLLNINRYLCWYCLGSHAANFAFIAIALLGGARVKPRIAAVPVAAAAFVLSSGVLLALDVASSNIVAERAEEDLADTDREMAEQIERQREMAQAAPADDEPDPAETADASADHDATDDADDRLAQADPDPESDPDAAPTGPPDPDARNAESQADYPPLAVPLDLPQTAYRTDGAGFTGRYRLGAADAPLRLLMMSNYQCDHCKEQEEIAMDLLREYGDRISLTHVHFPTQPPCNTTMGPTPMFQNSCAAALAAEVAGEMKGPAGFWQMHQQLFNKEGYFISLEDLNSMLAEIGYTPEEQGAFAQRLQRALRSESDPLLAYTRQDVELATDIGIYQTPMIFLNGVEVRGWQATGGLRRAVQAAAQRDPARLTARFDQPLSRFERVVEDWAVGARLTQVNQRDRLGAVLGPDDAPVRVTVFLDYASDVARDLDRRIRAAMADHPELISYTVRHYPVELSCNSTISTTQNAGACAMAMAAEAAGILGGTDAYFAAHDYMLLNAARPGTFDVDEMIDTLGPDIGLDPAAWRDQTDNPVANDYIQADTQMLRSVNKRSPAALFVNQRHVRGWSDDKLDGDVVRAVLERAIQEASEAGAG